MTQGQFVNAELSFAGGEAIEGSEAVCNGNTVILTPPETFDWAAAENQRLEARLRTDVLDGDQNRVVVTDLAGNPIEAAASWSFVVQRSAFAWTPTNLRLGGSDIVSSTLVNGRAEETSFTLTGVPTWITPSVTEGSLPAGGELEVDFALDLSAGLVADTIAATTDFGDALLYFTCGPDWQLDASAFEYTMSLTASLFVDGAASSDPNDLVAAFVGSELRGLASPGAGGSLSMTLYANRQQGDVVTFEIYDASDCRLYQGDQTIHVRS